MRLIVVLGLVLLVLLAGCGGLLGDDSGSAIDDGNGTSTDDTGVGASDTDGEDTQSVDDPPDIVFEEVSSELGLDHEALDSPGLQGGDGVYVVDVDGDLRSDLLVVAGGKPSLFENVGGEFEPSDAFEDAPSDVQGVLFFDHDNDGHEDVLFLRRGATPVLFENHDGEFERTDAGFEREFVSPTGVSAADYTGNGCLDLFVVDYDSWSDGFPQGWGERPGSFVSEADNGQPNQLYRGSCGTFEAVDDAGIQGDHWSFATSFVDLTGNGHPDIHVANDFFADELYTNQGDGTFEQEYLGPATDRNGMSSRAVDITGNGHLDLFVTNIYYPLDRADELPESERDIFVSMLEDNHPGRSKGNNLLVGSDGGFEDQGTSLGVNEGGWGWGAAVEDFDSSGHPDIVHGTQFQFRLAGDRPTYTRPFLFIQAENGTFTRANSEAAGFEESDDRGVAALDIDTSGGMDVAVATREESHRLYRNEADQANSLQVVVGPGETNHTSIGARVEATTNGTTQLRVNNAKADFQSQDTRTLHFGVGDSETVEELHVEWPDGTEVTFADIETGQRILVTPDGIVDRVQYNTG